MSEKTDRRSAGPKLSISLLVFAALSALAGPMRAQPLTWVGFSPHDALLLTEVGEGHFGPGPADYFGFAVASGDFDGDGADDLATGLPGNDCDFVVWDCGSVVVRWGDPEFPLEIALTLTQTHPAAPDPAEAFDEFGSALAAGDFNGDGRDDLAVGVGRNHDREGGVQVHYGLPGGIESAGLEFLRQAADGLPGTRSANDRFGAAVAVGDFDGDGFDDLAIGSPFDRDADDDGELPFTRSGTVTVAGGSADGLLPFGGTMMQQGVQDLPGENEFGDGFGTSLAAGDFDGDGYDDLAIGVPGEDEIGVVMVVYGSELSLLNSNHWHFGQAEIGFLPEFGDRFGEALAAGDFDGDGYDDLAIGAPGQDGGDPPSIADAGAFATVFGSPFGLLPTDAAWWWEDRLYGPGHTEVGDRFGAALAAGDFDGDGRDDLAVGAPDEGAGSADAGAVTVVTGGPSRLFGDGRRLRPGDYPISLLPDAEGGSPGYGAALAAGDFDGNGFADLAAGAPRRDGNQQLLDAGAVVVLFGRLFRDDFESGGTQFWPTTFEPN